MTILGVLRAAGYRAYLGQTEHGALGPFAIVVYRTHGGMPVRLSSLNLAVAFVFDPAF
ncbi:MAG: hypothetical protein ACRDKW_05705 [Actinomycetota bacterium]